MNSNQFYQAILDGFVSDGWVECVSTEDGYTYYAIHKPTSTMIDLFLTKEIIPNIETGTEWRG